MTLPIRVLIADDHEMVRSGLAAFLRVAHDMELAGEAANGADAIRLTVDRHPDVVLMDLAMPDIDGVSATREIRAQCPDVEVIALTSYLRDDLVHRALEAGALSYLTKNVGPADLAEAIRCAMTHQRTMAPEAAQALSRRASSSTPGHDLSAREREVLGLMVRGLSNRAIGERLKIGRSTVDFHVSNVLGKLGATSRTEAVATAVAQHLAT